MLPGQMRQVRTHQVKVGESTVTVGGRRFQIIGIVRPPASGNLSATAVFVPLADAQALLGLPETGVNTLDLQLTAGTPEGAVRERLVNSMPGLRPSSARDNLAATETLTGYAVRFAQLFMGLITAITVLVIYLTIAGSIRERGSQIAVLKTLGWTLSDLRRQIGLEVLIQGTLGSALGLVLGLVSVLELQSIRVQDSQAAQLVRGISGGNGFHGHVPSVALSLKVDPTVAAGVVILAIALGVVTALLVTKRMAVMKPTVLLGQRR